MPLLLVIFFVAAVIAAIYAFKMGAKERLKINTINFLMGQHPELTEKASTIRAALAMLLEVHINRYGNNFKQNHENVQLDFAAFMDQIAIRFEAFQILKIIQIFGRDLEVRVIDLKKEGKSITVGLLVNTAKGIILETFWYSPINGLEVKKKELQEIFNVAAIPVTKATQGFFVMKEQQLIPTVKDWGHKAIAMAVDPNKVRVAIDGKFGEMTKDELIEALRSSLFLHGENSVVFGDSGSGKTTLIEAWIHNMSGIIDPQEYRIVLLSGQQFCDLLAGYHEWFFVDSEEHKGKTVIVTDDVPTDLTTEQWQRLLSLMDGLEKERYGFSFLISLSCRDKDEFIQMIKDQNISKSFLRTGRMKYIVELRPYNRHQAAEYAKEIKKTLSLPYWLDESKIKEVFKVNTPISGQNSASFAEIVTAITYGNPPEQIKEPKSKSEEDRDESPKVISL